MNENPQERLSVDALLKVVGRINELENRVSRLEILHPETAVAPPRPAPTPSFVPPRNETPPMTHLPEPRPFEPQWRRPGVEAAPPTPKPEPAPPVISPIASPEPHFSEPRPEEDAAEPIINFESLIGGKWALWAGSLCLFLSIASLLVYVSHKYPIPPIGRVALGIGGGILLLFISGYLRPRTRRWFTEGLAGTGLAICFLSLWAGAQILHVLPWGPVYLAMGTTVAVGAGVALAFDAFSLIALSTAGGFLTLWLFQAGGAPERAISYLAAMTLLNVCMTFISQFKRWDNLTWGCFGGTILCLGCWSLNIAIEQIRLPFFLFCTLFFLLFTGAGCFYSLRHGEETTDGDLLLLVAAGTVYGLAGAAFTDPWTKAFPATFPLVLGIFYALLSLYVRLTTGRHERLRLVCSAFAFLGGTIAIPIEFEREWLLLGWTAEAALLLSISNRLNSPLLRRAGQVVWLLSFLPWLDTVLNAPVTPHLAFLNQRALPMLGSLAVAAGLAYHALRRRDDSALPTDEIAGCYLQYAIFGFVHLLIQETLLGFRWAGYPTSFTHVPAALYFLSAELGIFAVGLFAMGIRGGNAQVRANAVLLAMAATALPFLTHASFPHPGWTPFLNLRLLAFLSAPATVLSFGFLASRHESSLSEPENEFLTWWPVATSTLLLFGLLFESYGAFDIWHSPANSQWEKYAALYLAMFSSCYGLLNVLAGRGSRHWPLRAFGYGITIAAAFVPFGLSADSQMVFHPFLNLRAATYLILAASWLTIAASLRRRDDVTEFEAQFPASFGLMATLWLVMGCSFEFYEACRQSAAGLGKHWQLWATFAVALWWTVSSAGIFAFGVLWRRLDWRGAAYLLGSLATLTIATTSLAASRLEWLPILNLRSISQICCTLLFAGAACGLHRIGNDISEEERQVPAWLAMGAGLLFGWFLTQEIYEGCFYFHNAIGPYWERWAQLLISLTWSLYATLLLLAGVGRQFKPLRLSGLALLAITLVKVFVFDLNFVGDSLRVLSLAGLGVSLIFISWLYSRFGVGEDHSTPTPV